MYIARVSPSIIQESIMSDFGVGATIFGQMAGYLYVTYLFMQIPVGALVDRFGAQRLIILNTFIFGLACMLFSFAKGILWIMIGRLLMGLAGSFAFIGAFKIALVWFPPSMLGLLAGLTQCSGMLGAAVG
ncbi:MAG: MFS transporter, partial [Legionellales bacterium]|nr:MFS transporter [Legionellales bacterium]